MKKIVLTLFSLASLTLANEGWSSNGISSVKPVKAPSFSEKVLLDKDGNRFVSCAATGAVVGIFASSLVSPIHIINQANEVVLPIP